MKKLIASAVYHENDSNVPATAKMFDEAISGLYVQFEIIKKISPKNQQRLMAMHAYDTALYFIENGESRRLT